MSNLRLTDDQKNYKDDKGIIYDRVTSFIHKFTSEFDTEGHAERLAYSPKKSKYKNLSKDEIKLMWSENNKLALEKGTYVHSRMEQLFVPDLKVAYRPDLVPEDLIYIYANFVRSLKLDTADKLYSEFKLSNSKIRIAGTTDLKIVHKGLTSFIDYKTNKELLNYSPYGNYFKDPLYYIADCDINIYTIQMSLYAYMDELTYGSKINQLNIIHFNGATPVMIPIEYRKDLILELLHYDKRL